MLLKKLFYFVDVQIQSTSRLTRSGALQLSLASQNIVVGKYTQLVKRNLKKDIASTSIEIQQQKKNVALTSIVVK